jgi:hypothetical protein
MERLIFKISNGLRVLMKSNFVKNLLLYLAAIIHLATLDLAFAEPSIKLAQKGIHRVPIIIQGFQIRPATRYPLATYQLFKTNKSGKAQPIPFQIDEINQWGDYVLPHGSEITSKTGNNIFDLQDELALMGDDVGPVSPPKSWPENLRPTLVYELRFDLPNPPKGVTAEGAVYLGIFFRDKPKPSPRNYVNYSPSKQEVMTSRYHYKFDRLNYLVVDGVDMFPGADAQNPSPQPEEIVASSTFFMKADLKYFVTLRANHRTVNSQIEAYKHGPIRSIVRVSFFYTFLKLKFELGMYTEISFFSNAVHLPAILYNPIDGPKSLNSGSGFYYGFAFKKNPTTYKIDSNMPRYGKMDFISRLSAGKPTSNDYWLSLLSKDRMFFIEFFPSKQMIKANNPPQLYIEDQPPANILKRSNDIPLELGKSPVNLGLFFDLTKLSKGEHQMNFRLYFENKYSASILRSIKTAKTWRLGVMRI